VHNKGVIVDNKSVLISSINWNENSFTNNREVGVIITHPSIAQYYCQIFLADWNLSDPFAITINSTYLSDELQLIELNAHTIYIGALFTMTFIVVARDWRKRSWP
jgi:phosphatidylserine/phosphatidylglycerophosphate/cardiolipin synthase-like enzyme